MSVSDSFREFAIEQLRRAMIPVRVKRMFGGIGLYSGSLFFALMDNGILYFKTDAESEKEFIERGMRAFQPFGDDGASMHYHEVPEDVLENPDELHLWGNRAIDVARKSNVKSKRPQKPGFVPLSSYLEYEPDEMLERSRAFASELQRRRTTRHFSKRPVAREVIEACIEAAGTAPSGAHQQPWHFVVVSNADLKKKIREAAERAERDFYSTAPKDWLAALEPLGTDAVKAYLEDAPYLIAVFAERYGISGNGKRRTHYYVQESVGIATGFLLAALHHAGLVALTHTPSPMEFLRDLLERPINERPLMLIVTGYPAAGAKVPDLTRKPLDKITTFLS